MVRKGALIGGLLLVSVAAFVRDDVFRSTVIAGDVWRQENLLAPYEFAIRKPPEVLAEERRQARDGTPPIFREVPDARETTRVRRDSLAARIEGALEIRSSAQAARSRGRLEEARRDSVRFDSARAGIGFSLSARQWTLLSESYDEGRPDLPAARRAGPPTPRLDRMILDSAFELCVRLQRAGVLDVPLDSVRTPLLVVRDDVMRRERMAGRSTVHGRNDVYREARAGFVARFGARADTVAIGTAVVGVLLEPSLRYDVAATATEIETRIRGISPSEGAVRQNEVIVRRGDVVTPEIRLKLISLEQEEAERRGDRFAWAGLFGHILLTVTVYLIFFLYLYLLRRPIWDDNRMVFLMTILFGVVIGLFAVALRFATIDMYVVPVAIVGILLTIIFDSRVAIFGLLTLTLLGALYRNLDFIFALATLFGGSLGVFSVRDIRNRGQFFASAGLVFAGYATVLVGAFLVQATSTERLLGELTFVGMNAFLVLLAYPLLWVFERTFDLTTDLTLLELSDTNRPLLKDLSLRAPGTFNHVLQVANLAEAAASAIGANALLTRVGALYHDIGKMVKSEYFVENQRLAANPHDQLKPRMSALIIASHVKEGIEMGRQHGLPQRVLDFIPMHHGTTRIEYFYRRALEQRKEEDAPLLESEFRYPGPRPDSKETAVLMLADSIEAASRTLRNPNHKRLESLIDTMVATRLEDGQLDDADLTFRDLTVIKSTLLNLLLGVYHVRVKYPSPSAQEEPEPEP